MDPSELRDTLERLHQELEQADDLDDESLLRLQRLAKDIDGVLEREGVDDEGMFEAIGEDLNDAIQDFEVDHPSLTGMLRHMLDTLSGAGI